MSRAVRLSDLDGMTLDERLELVEAIWDSIALETEGLELSEAQKRELDRRMAELDAQPDNVLTWEEIKARVRGGRR